MKKTINNILNAEKKFDIFNSPLAKYWAHYRIRFQYKLLHDIGVIENVHYSRNIPLIEKIRYFILCMIKLNFLSIIFSKANFLIFSHPRSVDGDDIFSKQIKDTLDDDYFNMSHSEKSTFTGKRDSHTDLFRILAKISGNIFYFLIRNKNNNMINNILESVDLEDKKKIDAYQRDFRKSQVEYKVLYCIYKFILYRTRFKLAYIVTSYYNLPLVHALRERNIRTIELQHGVISKYHLGYSCLDNNTKVPFCDEIYMWGEYWITANRIPTTVRLKVIGNSLIVDLKAVKSDITRETNLIIISQVSISEALFDFILSNVNSLENYNVYYKLHPGEFDRKLKFEKAFEKFDHINVISNELKLDNLIKLSQIQVGAYSTGLFEGLNNGLVTLLIDSPGTCYMSSLISSGDVSLVHNLNVLKNKVAIRRGINNGHKKYFSEFNVNEFLNDKI